MAFSMSYKGVTDRDIKYVYSDQKINFTYPIKSRYTERKRDDIPLPPLKKYPRRFYEYYPSMNIGLPKASAFRGCDQDQVERIVTRICKPIQCQNKRRRDLPREDVENVENSGNEAENRGSETRRSDASRATTSRDIKDMIARLQKPTKSSSRKSYKERKQEQDKDEAHKDTEIPPLGSIRKLPPIRS